MIALQKLLRDARRDAHCASVDGNIVMEGPANWQRGWEAVGGWLVLSEHSLAFCSHKMNVQNGTIVIARVDVVNARKCWTKLFDVMPLIPNSIRIETRFGDHFRFVVHRRTEWMEMIEGCRTQEYHEESAYQA